jgi:hypothetical protein
MGDVRGMFHVEHSRNGKFPKRDFAPLPSIRACPITALVQ